MKINFKQLNNRFGNISYIDALNLLCWTFEASQARVVVDGQSFALVDLYDVVKETKASECSLQFYGGPPTGRWWEGTLLTMLLDHFLYAYSKNDLKKVHDALKVPV
jgi:hypothetical protein